MYPVAVQLDLELTSVNAGVFIRDLEDEHRVVGYGPRADVVVAVRVRITERDVDRTRLRVTVDSDNRVDAVEAIGRELNSVVLGVEAVITRQIVDTRGQPGTL